MPITVDKDTCIGCGTCEALCPMSFKLNAEGKAEPIAQEVKECTKQAAESCPVQAISIE